MTIGYSLLARYERARFPIKPEEERKPSPCWYAALVQGKR
jgi:hypothetical protein